MRTRITCCLFVQLLTTCAHNSFAVRTAVAEPAAGTAIVYPIDGAIMVYVPAGEFIMGMDIHESDRIAKALGYKDYREIASEEWAPRRTESIPGYFIDE